MGALAWDEKFNTGLGAVDAQHRRLVSLLDAFGEACTRPGGVDQPSVTGALGELADYAQSHFTAEEALMAARGIDARFFAQHKDEHADFVAQVGRLSVVASDDAGARQLFQFLVGWLTFHILGTDQRMARQLRRLDDGLSAQQAYALEEAGQDVGAGLLLRAFGELLGLVDERNRALSRANEDLERRVAERTAQLSDANTSLRASVEALEARRAELLAAHRALESEVAERLKVELELRQAQKLKAVGALAAGIAHEFNTPLQYVGDSVQFLSEAVEDLLSVAAPSSSGTAALSAAELRSLAEAGPRASQRAKDGLGRMAGLVRSLKTFAQADSTGQTSVDLNAAVASTVAVAKPQLEPTADVVLHLGALPPVVCEVGAFNQALLAVLMNGAQAIAQVSAGKGQRGTLTVRTKHEGAHALVVVEDTGGGVPAAVQERIFEPFFTTRPVGQGAGQGLAVARSIIVDGHHGQLWFETELGRGSRFFLKVPLEGVRPVLRAAS